MGNRRLRFGRYIKARRESQGWSMRKLARKSKLSLGMVFRCETGKTSPNLETLEWLAKAFGETVPGLLVRHYDPTLEKLMEVGQ